MDFPAVTLPILKADRELDGKDAHQVSAYHGSDDTFVWENYNSSRVHGMPTSLQVVGKRLEEEKLLAISELFVEALRK
jgi:amidase